MERENDLYLQSTKNTKRYFITLNKDCTGIHLENVYSNIDITLDDIFINHLNIVRVHYIDSNKKSVYSTSLTDGLEFIKIEECKLDLNQETYNEYLALKYIHIVDGKYPRTKIRTLQKYISKLDGYNSNNFHKYKKMFYRKGIRDEYITKEVLLRLNELEEQYDIPKHAIELKGWI